MLSEVGIDVVNVGNNHAGDYGPYAIREELDRLSAAGISYTGGGYDAADARTPAYRVIGDTVVAFVGADLTIGHPYRARKALAGILNFPGLEPDKADRVIQGLTAILEKARKFAHVVLLTPHWGDNGLTEPTDATRKIAHGLIKAGYDGILGHSAHLLQGVELIDGKPVVYDAGNLLLDGVGSHPDQHGMLYEVELDRAGVQELRARPLYLRRNQADLAEGRHAEAVLEKWSERTAALGTKFSIDGNIARIACDPGGIRGPEGVVDLPKRPVFPEIRPAPSDVRADGLPATATPVNIHWDNGISLLGYELVLDRLPMPIAAQVVTLYWTTDRPVSGDIEVRIEAKRGDRRRLVNDHIPGDWILPVDRWAVGEIVRDEFLMRLDWEAGGTVRFYAGLAARRAIPPVQSDQELEDGSLLYLGDATYEKGAPPFYKVLGPRIEARAQARAHAEGAD